MVSQAAEEDCLVLPEPLRGEFSTPSPENSAVVEKAEEPLVPKETQDSNSFGRYSAGNKYSKVTIIITVITKLSSSRKESHKQADL